jgi:hypothetical protein
MLSRVSQTGMTGSPAVRPALHERGVAVHAPLQPRVAQRLGRARAAGLAAVHACNPNPNPGSALRARPALHERSTATDAPLQPYRCPAPAWARAAELGPHRSEGRGADPSPSCARGQALGDAGLEQRVDRNIALAQHWAAAVAASGGAFQLVAPRSFANVCFWWLPPGLRPLEPAAAPPAALAALGKVAPAIKTRMQQAGDAMIGFQPSGRLPNFFRLVFSGATTLTFADLDALMRRMDAIGSELFPA